MPAFSIKRGPELPANPRVGKVFIKSEGADQGLYICFDDGVWAGPLAEAGGAVPVKATGAEVDAGTDDAKFITALALTDSDYIKEADLPEGGITNSAGANVVPKSDGTNLVASQITDNIDVTIRTADTAVVEDFAGNIVLRGGDAPDGDGGNVSLQAGTGGNFDGRITLTSPRPLVITAPLGMTLNGVTVPANTAGAAQVPKGDAGNNLIPSLITDDAPDELTVNSEAGIFKVGDINSAANSTRIVLTDSTKEIQIFTGTESVIFNGVAKTINFDENDLLGLNLTLDGLMSTVTARLTPVAFAALPASPAEGMMAWVNDSNTVVWGATVAAGGTDKVLAVYNGTNWTVAGK